ncbi:MAG: response regulator, partial [Chroococcales cyanobacterium]
MKILLIDDDHIASSVLSEVLQQHFYTVEVVTDGQIGLNSALSYEYDLLLVDWLIPKLDGITLCRQLRSKGYSKPILLLTAKDGNQDIVTGLDAGADDYVVKPYEISELMARIRALLRREKTAPASVLKWGDLCLNPVSCEVTYQGKAIALTAKEYSLLELFLRSPQRVFSRSAIIDRLWSFDESPGENTVTTHIKDLRRRLKGAGMTVDVIETVYGLGYRLKPPPETSPSPNSPGNKKLNALAKVLDRYRDTFAAQVVLLEDAVKALQEDHLSVELREQATQNAHKLAGSLGTFGYPSGSQFARQIEQLLSENRVLGYQEYLKLEAWVLALQTELKKPPIPLEAKPILTLPQFRVLIVDDDFILTEYLKTQATLWGIKMEIATDLDSARKAIATSPPNAVLLDLTFPNSEENGLEFLEELSRKFPLIPVLVFTAQDSFAVRVKVARLGGKAFLQKPVTANQVLTAVSQVLEKSSYSEAKLLIVDSDLPTLDSLRSLLQPWGYKLTLLDKPEQFWETLEKTRPDLIISALEMNSFSGIDLCQVVRNEPRWAELPILLLANNPTAEMVQGIFSAGADDYLAKPIREAELIGRILARLERAKLLKNLANTDELTGLTNRRKGIEDITHLLGLAQRQERPMSIGLVDLDHFQQINDSYGPEIGDRILMNFSQLLKQCLRREDVICRW